MLAFLLACDPVSSVDPHDSGDSTQQTDSADSGDPIDTSAPELRRATFAGEVATVSGSPLGLGEAARGTPVTAELVWDLSVNDSDKGDPNRGTYEHHGTSEVRVDIGGRVVVGSGSATVNVYNGTTDSFGMEDGSKIVGDAHPRMFVDGLESIDLGLFFAIVNGDGSAFPSDEEPEDLTVFNPVDDPHTFALTDGGGTLLLQFTELVE